MGEERFERHYTEHAARVVRYARFRTRSYSDAEDIAAETFSRLLSRLDRITDDAVLPWLLKVSGNLCTDLARKRARVVALDQAPSAAAEDSPFDRPEVAEAVRSLSRKQQQVLFLRVIEDLEFKRIAEVTGRSESAVKMMYKRTIDALREQLEEDEADAVAV